MTIKIINFRVKLSKKMETNPLCIAKTKTLSYFYFVFKDQDFSDSLSIFIYQHKKSIPTFSSHTCGNAALLYFIIQKHLPF